MTKIGVPVVAQWAKNLTLGAEAWVWSLTQELSFAVGATIKKKKKKKKKKTTIIMDVRYS